jgi:extracellular elastinolytic metalloproteinase
MHPPRFFRGCRRLLAAAAFTALAAMPAAAHAIEPAPGDYDARAAAAGAQTAPSARRAQKRLRHSLGDRGVVRVDPLTGTPRFVGRLDGALTGRSGRQPLAVALSYLRGHAAAFGLDRDDLDRLDLTRRYRSRSGLSHLQLAQTYRGIPAFGAGVTANVDAQGRLVNLVGAPRPDLAVRQVTPRLGSAAAMRRARRDVGDSGSLATRGPGRDRASLVLFPGPRKVRLAWRVLVFADSGHVYDSVVDARSGEVLHRHDLLHQATGFVHRNYPGASAGGTQTIQAFSTSGNDPWLTAFDRLEGNNAVAYSDQGDNLYTGLGPGNTPTPAPAAANLVAPDSDPGTTSAAWSGVQATEGNQGVLHRSCPASGCTWNGFNSSFSWTNNRKQAATQAFYFVNTFHDHLRSDPGIAFDEGSGNFEAVNSPGIGSGNDPVHVQVDDGGSLESGTWPDCEDHSNNANMTTLPEGESPKMQMYLFTGFCDTGVNDVNGADDGFVVYHEYGHGLSGRLITDSSGYEALGSDQAGAMGEAWSDWYAHDFLVEQGLEADSGNGSLPNTPYEGLPFRTQPMNCPVGSGAPACPHGGYTYGDFGKIAGGAEVHADGEIWGDTLWDLRRAMLAAHPADGVLRTRAIVTDGMRLSPPEPTFLDMRDAILQAEAARGFGDHNLVLSVFTHRGMGLCASITGGTDTSPKEDFRAPGANCSASVGGSKPQPAPVSPPGPASSPPKPRSGSSGAAPGRPRLGGRRARADRRGRFRYSIKAGAGLRATLGASVRRRRRARLTVARAAATVSPTGRGLLRARLSSRGRRLLRRRHRLAVRVKVVVRSSAGLESSASGTLTLVLRP